MKYLKVEHIIGLNEKIYRDSLVDKEIEYSGKDDYPTDIGKIKKLIKSVPKGTIIDVATYYLKNIILLQAFPNGNHRTAILSVAFFLKMNGKLLRHPLDEYLEFHKNSFRIQSKIYGSLEARGTTILKEEPNEFHYYCRKFIEEHLSESN